MGSQFLSCVCWSLVTAVLLMFSVYYYQYNVLLWFCNLLLSRAAVHTEIGGYSSSTIALIAAAVTVSVLASIPRSDWGLPDPNDTLPWEWNADGVAAYWDRRPVALARRAAAVTLTGLSVGLGLLLDRATGETLDQCALGVERFSSVVFV